MPIDSPSSGMPKVQTSPSPADEAETALADTLAWLASATQSDGALVDLERASRQLEARIAAEAVGRGGRSRSRAARRSFGRQWQALTLAAAVAACILCLLLRSRVVPQAPTPARVEEVRFDPSLWELDDITATRVGREAVGMSRLFRR